uniref:LysM peptidoglycan-binding domain-containing protein n=1 Tax=Sporosarcina koreensis TaxID=334735 RepID=UPI000B0864C4
ANGDADKGTSANQKDESKKPPVSVHPPAVEKETPKKTEAPKKTETPKVEEKPKAENNTKAKTHIVAPNETLYRISMNYYGSDAGIEKIKKANGLSSNNIMTGQKLIIP